MGLGPPPPAPRLPAAGDVVDLLLGLRRQAGRGLFLIAWCLVLWGTLVFLSLLYDLVREGLPALRHFDPRTHDSLAAWVNVGCALVAPAVWLLVLTAIVLAHRKPRSG